MRQKFLCALILYSYDGMPFKQSLIIKLKVLMTIAPVVFVLDSVNLWYNDNKQFFFFVILSLIMNTVVGMWYHLKNKTFKWEEFFTKNIQMWFILVIVYAMLEFLRLTAGDNIAGEVFKVTIQIATLLYPISKVLKNCYILSNKQFPPKFIMDKLYKFEQEGDVKDLFSKKEEEEKENNETL